MENQQMPELQTPQTAGKTIWIIVAAVIGAAVIAAPLEVTIAIRYDWIERN